MIDLKEFHNQLSVPGLLYVIFPPLIICAPNIRLIKYNVKKQT